MHDIVKIQCLFDIPYHRKADSIYLRANNESFLSICAVHKRIPLSSDFLKNSEAKINDSIIIEKNHLIYFATKVSHQYSDQNS